MAQKSVNLFKAAGCHVPVPSQQENSTRAENMVLKSL